MPLSLRQRRRALRTPADWPEDQLPYPLDELADAERPTPDNSFQNLPNPTAPNQLQRPRPDRDLDQPGPDDTPNPFTLPPPVNDAFLVRLCGPNPPQPRPAHRREPRLMPAAAIPSL